MNIEGEEPLITCKLALKLENELKQIAENSQIVKNIILLKFANSILNFNYKM